MLIIWMLNVIKISYFNKGCELIFDKKLKGFYE